jgi:dehydrogenase/reductase SDR family member 4
MSVRRLEGKICVVTASSDGIGFAIAKRLGAEGAKVVVSSRKQANVDEAVSKLKSEGIVDVLGVTCHVAKESDRKKLFDETFKKFGGIDVLVSNAAVNPAVGSVLEATEEVWDKIFDVNVKASYLLAKEVKPYIVKRGGGSVVFISSIGGYQPFDLLGAYSVSKTALFGLTKAAALDLVKDNIRVNCVAPGVIETKFSSAVS